MYIEPNTVIKLLHNVPLDSSYKDTIYFSSADSQSSYFSSLSKFTMTNFTYQRKEHILRVSRPADDFYDCNYIMFQNSSFGNKWFYAFVASVEYVSNESTNIVFELDHIQSWLFDFVIKPSFVEREHSVTDSIGDNLVPENLETGEYVYRPYTKTGNFLDKSYVVAATFDKDLNPGGGQEYMGVYSGLIYNVFERPNDVTNFINAATVDNKADGIVGIFVMPSDFITTSGNGKSILFTCKPNTSDIDGYVPKNKKLFTYPYNFLHATCNQNSELNLRYEYFDKDPNGNCIFYVMGGLNNSPEFILVPVAYKGVARNFDEMLVLSGLPVCSYATDTFKAWWAQNSGTIAVNMAGTLLGGAQSGVSTAMSTGSAGAGVASAASSSILGVASTIATFAQHYTMAHTAHGITNSNVIFAANAMDFYTYPTTITAQFAKIIDEFWTMFGYPSHRVKVPNISFRRHWNYVKTINVNIVGSVPVYSMLRIKQAFNDGITWWKNGAEVGNYNLDNSI